MGFWGTNQYVAGVPGAVYSILVDAEVVVNGRFVLLEAADIHCPAHSLTYCVAERGTYFGEVGIIFSTGDRLEVIAGSADIGFSAVRLNSQPLSEARGTAESSLTAKLISNRSLEVQLGLYSIRMDVIDGYLDLTSVNTHCWACLLDNAQPEGLLGRTWNNSQEHLVDEQTVDLYRERDGDLLGCSFGVQHKHSLSLCGHGSKSSAGVGRVTALRGE